MPGESERLRVSVVIPSYNRARELPRALASVRSQGLRDIEVIVVDDASTPPVAAAADGLRVLRHERNRGAAAARNTGVAAARGEYVAFLDADDSWRPEKLTRQIAALDAAPPEVIGSLTGFAYYRDGAATGGVHSTPQVEDWHRFFLNGCRCSPGSTLMVRRAAFEAVGPFDERLRRLEDWDWLLRGARGRRFLVVDAVLADVYLSGRPARAVVEDTLRQIEAKHQPLLTEPAERRAFRATLALERAAAAYWSGRPLAATAQTLKAGIDDPGNALRHVWRWLSA